MDEADDSAAEDGADAETSPKLFTFPPVEPELLHYFSCNLCDAAGFDDVETYFAHLWRTHTEFHMVGGRIQRIPIRLRPQLFVICALCGLNNKGSTGFSNTYLTTAHLPHHAALLRPPRAPLRCDTCRAEFADRAELALHALDAEHGNAAHRCPVCADEVEGDLNYIAHLRAHYMSRLFQCYFCMTLFATETGCIAHIKKHHAEDYSVHKCSSCGYATALFHDFLLHIRSHSQLNRHVCHVCGVMFVSKMSLKHHIPTHTDSHFPCEQCNKIFSHPQTRRRHVINAHNNPEKCTCPECGRQFGSAYSMKRHYMIHTGERPYQCDKCGRGFVQKGDLQAHYKRCKFTEVTGVFVTI
ncbi:zinc finger protein 569-like [Pollicipes pollicipes]|uniref:zinc finger protein 569-like n=1 Tax=Pollicipes pollicipes TaxID=41117 RepID=UPI001885457C|nr:zinc finger protein 569-like [Pollicipes pollicipes]